MSRAWEVTNEDIITVLNMSGIDQTNFIDEDDWNEHIDLCMNTINEDVVETAILNGDDTMDRTEYANQSICEQLTDAGLM